MARPESEGTGGGSERAADRDGQPARGAEHNAVSGLSEVRKEYARKMEYLDDVRDGREGEGPHGSDRFPPQLRSQIAPEFTDRPAAGLGVVKKMEDLSPSSVQALDKKFEAH